MAEEMHAAVTAVPEPTSCFLWTAVALTAMARYGWSKLLSSQHALKHINSDLLKEEMNS